MRKKCGKRFRMMRKNQVGKKRNDHLPFGHELDEHELSERIWSEERDYRRNQLFLALKPYRKWGVHIPMPRNHASPYLRCDQCPYPRAQAEYVVFCPDQMLCKKHYNRYRNRRRRNPILLQRYYEIKLNRISFNWMNDEKEG